MGDFEEKEFRTAYGETAAVDLLKLQLCNTMKDRGLSPQALAKASGVSTRTIRRLRYEDLGSTVRLETLFKIAAVLDVAVSIKFISFDELYKSRSHMSESNLTVPPYKTKRRRT